MTTIRPNNLPPDPDVAARVAAMVALLDSDQVDDAGAHALNLALCRRTARHRRAGVPLASLGDVFGRFVEAVGASFGDGKIKNEKE